MSFFIELTKLFKSLNDKLSIINSVNFSFGKFSYGKIREIFVISKHKWVIFISFKLKNFDFVNEANLFLRDLIMNSFSPV